MQTSRHLLFAGLLALAVSGCRPPPAALESPGAEHSPPVQERGELPLALADEAEPVESDEELEADAARDALSSPDGDEDGVPDAIDACPDAPEDHDGDKDEDGCPECGYPGNPCALELNRKIGFASNTADFTRASLYVLDDLVAILEGNPDITIEIRGHTDSSGSDRVNLELSEQRANRVREYLIDAGIAPERVTAKGYGETIPIDSNRTAEGRENNRRIEIVRTDASACPM